MVLLSALLILSSISQTVNAMDYTAPSAPGGTELTVPETETFLEGLTQLLTQALALVAPAATEAGKICLRVLCGGLLLAMVKLLPGGDNMPAGLTGALTFSALLMGNAGSLIRLGEETVRHLSEYGRLLLPVMTAAMAAQGYPTASAALHFGTAAFDALLCVVLEKIVIPLLWCYLCLSVACGALSEQILEKLRDLIKWLISWLMKLVLYAFTGFLGLTGVVSGSADAAALKAAKISISTMVPMVGGILSDASEAVLTSASLMKSAAGIYGIFTCCAIVLGPFVRIGVQYLMMKLTCAISGMFVPKGSNGILQDYTTAMGIVLGMTGSMAFLVLVSTVCMIKGGS